MSKGGLLARPITAAVYRHVDPTKTAVERGCSNPTSAAIANAARVTDTHVVTPPLKLHAIGSKISWVTTAGPLLQRLPRNTPRATTRSKRPKAAIRIATPSPTTARDILICPTAIPAYPSPISPSSASKTAATTIVSGRGPRRLCTPSWSGFCRDGTGYNRLKGPQRP